MPNLRFLVLVDASTLPLLRTQLFVLIFSLPSSCYFSLSVVYYMIQMLNLVMFLNLSNMAMHKTVHFFLILQGYSGELPTRFPRRKMNRLH